MECGESSIGIGFTEILFRIFVMEHPGTIIELCEAFATTTGDFKCRNKKWSATLTLTEAP